MVQDYATPGDVADLTLTGDTPSEDQVGRLLDAAYVKLAAKAPGLALGVAAGRIDPSVVRLVLVEMVQAVVRNPTGQRSGSSTTGPFSQSWSWDSAAAPGLLVVTDEHLEMLGMPAGHGTYTVDAPIVPAWLPACARPWDAWW